MNLRPLRTAPWALAWTIACGRAPSPAEPGTRPEAQGVTAEVHAPGAASGPAEPDDDAAPARASTGGAPSTTLPAADEAAAASSTARACGHGERLDSGCTCEPGIACFDICCAPGSGCAHPAEPGGPSACMLNQRPPRPRPCRDGEFLSSGCACEGTTCIDLCCVGSACSHHSSPDGGYAKCVHVR